MVSFQGFLLPWWPSNPLILSGVPRAGPSPEHLLVPACSFVVIGWISVVMQEQGSRLCFKVCFFCFSPFSVAWFAAASPRQSNDHLIMILVRICVFTLLLFQWLSCFHTYPSCRDSFVTMLCFPEFGLCYAVLCYFLLDYKPSKYI